MSATKYTIEKFYLLRSYVVKNHPFEELDEKILLSLSELRNKSLSLLFSTSSSRKEFEDLSFSCWEILSSLTTNSIFYLPPPYLNNSLKELVSKALGMVYVMEFNNSPLAEGSNLVLYGLKGVGKTTLLHALGAICAVLASKTLPLYWIYEKESLSLSHLFPSPYLLYDLMLKLYAAESSMPTGFNVNNSEQFVESEVIKILDSSSPSSSTYQSNRLIYHENYERNVKNSPCLFLLDEIAPLYLNEKVDVISELKQMARYGHSAFILTSSCFNIQKYIFPKHYHRDHQPTIISSFQGLEIKDFSSPAFAASLPPSPPVPITFPDLNNSLFHTKQIRPLRNISEIVLYYRKRYREEIDEAKAKEIFYFTGGIGRFIHIYYQRKEFSDPSEEVSRLITCKEAKHLFIRLTLNPISSSDILSYANKELIDDWIDNLLVYEENGIYMFALPYMKDKFNQYFTLNKKLLAAFFFKQQRLGFEGGSTGHSNENFISQYLYRLPDLALSNSNDQTPQYSLVAALSGRHYGCKIVAIREELDDGPIEVIVYEKSPFESIPVSSSSSSTPPTTTTTTLPPLLPLPPLSFYFANEKEQEVLLNTFENLSGCLMKWKLDGYETGLDRVWFKVARIENGRREIKLFGAQIKTGKDTVSFEPGLLSTEASKAKATDCNDRTIAGVLIKAEMGFGKLLSVLSSLLFGVQDVSSISVDTLFIITNKMASNAYEKHWQRQINHQIHSVTDSRKITANGISFENFNCRLIDGTEWLSEIIPSEFNL